MFLGRRRWANRWRESDLVSVTFGVTAPTGPTEENPYLLGARGVEHLHIQFGSGTFDPVLEATYAFRFTPSATAGAYAAGRFPLYENARGFRAPFDASIGVNASHALGDRIFARAELGADYQGYGAWDGVCDPNTGLISTSALVGASAAFERFVLGADIRVPVTKRTLNEGDTFRQGPTIVVTIHTDSTNTYTLLFDTMTQSVLVPPTMDEIQAESRDWGMPVRWDAQGRPNVFVNPSPEHIGHVDIVHVLWAPIDPFENDDPERPGHSQ